MAKFFHHHDDCEKYVKHLILKHYSSLIRNNSEWKTKKREKCGKKSCTNSNKKLIICKSDKDFSNSILSH